MSNFKFLLSDPGFVPFAEVAMAAENGGVGNPAEPRQTEIAKKIPNAGILWVNCLWKRMMYSKILRFQRA